VGVHAQIRLHLVELIIERRLTVMSAILKEIFVSKPVSQFLRGPKKMLIDGKWVSAGSGKTFAVTNPATGDVITHVAEGDKADVDAAVRAAAARLSRVLGPR
jgi:hypothetical protein